MLGYQHEADLGGCWEYIQQYTGRERIDVLASCGKVLDRTCEAVAMILDIAEHLGESSTVGGPRDEAVVGEGP